MAKVSFAFLLCWALLCGATLLAQPSVVSLSPVRNSNNAPLTTNVDVTFTDSMASPTSGNFVLHRAMGNRFMPPAYSGGATSTLQLNPNQNLKPGERVAITLTTGIQNDIGTPMNAPHIFEFWGAASGGPGYFVDLSTVLPSTSSRLSYSVAAADLNLDGLVDLVVGNTGSMKSIFLQGAGGSFTSGADFGTTNQALTIRLGHVNNDNLIDVVIGNYGALNVWYAGTGGGSFGTGQIFGASPNDGAASNTQSLVLADFDGDGDLDVIEGNFNAGATSSLIIRFNNGSGTFTSPLAISPNNMSISGLTYGDVDNDGDLDLIAVCAGNSSPSADSRVFYNTGIGVFATNSVVGTLADDARQVDIADLNNDGFLDLVIANKANQASRIFMNDGSGGYGTGVDIGATTLDSRSVRCADFNGDGWMDIAFGNYAALNTMFLNDGTGSFTLAARTFGSATTQTTAITHGDFDGDGDIDIAEVSASNAQSNRVFRNEIGPQMLSIAQSTYSINESAGTLNIPVSRVGSSASDVSVQWTLVDATATGGVDFVAASGTLMWASGDGANKTITLDVTDDTDIEGNETLMLQLLMPVGAATIGTGVSTITILDDDTQPTMSFTAAAQSVAEDVGSITFTIELSNPYHLVVEANFGQTQGSALAGEDYFGNSGFATFQPGETSKSFMLMITDDMIAEPDESFDIYINNPMNCTFGVALQTITIQDNDMDNVGVSFGATSASISETGTSITVDVMLTVASMAQVDVDYTTNNLTATAGSDYTSASGTLSFAIGETMKTITVDVLDDALDENDETFSLALSNVMGGVLGTNSTTTITIQDDDPEPTLSFALNSQTVAEDIGDVVLDVMLSTASGRSVSVDYTAIGIGSRCVAGEDFTALTGTLSFAAGETMKQLTVMILDDANHEPTQDLVVDLSNVVNASLGAPSITTISITDNDTQPTVGFGSAAETVAENVGTAMLEVILDNFSDYSVTIDYATSDGSAIDGMHFTGTSGTLTFPEGQASMMIPVMIIDDVAANASRDFTLTLSNPMLASAGSNLVQVITISDDEGTPAFGFSAATLSAGEGSGTLMVDVLLSAQSSMTLTIDVSAADGSASDPVDYSFTPVTLTFLPGVQMQQVMLTITDDSFFEGDEVLTLSLSNPSIGSQLGGIASATLTITDDETQPTVAFTVASQSVSESAVMLSVDIELIGTAQGDVTVNLASADGSAISPADYTAMVTTLTFLSGETLKSVSLMLSDDGVYEGDEMFTLNLSSPTVAVLGAIDSQQITLIDDESAPTLSLSTSTLTVQENGGSAAVMVSLSVAAATTIMVDYATMDGSALAPADYTNTSGTLTFLSGETMKSIVVPIADDALTEGSESFTLALMNPVSAMLGTPATVSIAIADDESPPEVAFAQATRTFLENVGQVMIMVVLNQASALPVTVNWASADQSANAGSDYLTSAGTLTFNAGELSKQIPLSILNNQTPELDETLTITLSSPTNAVLGANSVLGITITDDDPISVSLAMASVSINEAGASLALNVMLSHAALAPISVDYATQTGTADLADFTAASGTLTFGVGVSVQQIQLMIADDLTFEGDEDFSIAISSPVGAVLGATTSTTITITDDEATPSFNFSSVSLSAPETQGSVTLSVDLSPAASTALTIDVATMDGSALAAADYTTLMQTLIFMPGETSKTVMVTLLDDLLPEGDESFTLLLTNPAAPATLGLADVATVTIVDDDSPPSISFTQASRSVAESVGALALDVQLNKSSAQIITVDFALGTGSAADGQDFTFVPGTLTFQPGVTIQSIALSVTDDTTPEALETLSIALSNPVNASLGTITTSTISISDNDLITVSISPATANVAEASGMVALTVTLSSPAFAPVTVGYADQGISAAAGTDYQPLSGTLNFAIGEQSKNLSLVLIDDAVPEMDETLSIQLVNPQGITLGTPSSAGITILNDDAFPDVSFASASATLAESVGFVQVSVQLSVAANLPATVQWTTMDGTGLAGVDYLAGSGSLSFTAGESSKTITIQLIDNPALEVSKDFSIVLSAPTNAQLIAPTTTTITIQDDDVAILGLGQTSYQVAENAGLLQVSVGLAPTALGSTSVDVSTSDLSALAGSDYTSLITTLTFAAGESLKMVSVPIINNALVGGNRQFSITLTNANGATLSATNASAIITIQEDDVLPTLSFSQTVYSQVENLVALSVPLTLNASYPQPVTVDVATMNLTALAGLDYLAINETLTFQPGETLKNISITLIDDSIYEGAQTFRLALSSPVNALLSPSLSSVTITILENDPNLPPQPPVFQMLEVVGPDSRFHAGEAITIRATMGEQGITVSANLANLDTTLSASTPLLSLGGGVYQLQTPALDAATLIEGNALVVPVTAINQANQSTTQNLSITIDNTPPMSFLSLNVASDAIPVGDLFVIIELDEATTTAPLLTLTGLGVGVDVSGVAMQGSAPGQLFTYLITIPAGTPANASLNIAGGADATGNAVLHPPARLLTLTGSTSTLQANAGADQTINVSSPVMLDGSASIGATSYQWTQLDGPQQLMIQNPTSAIATVTPTIMGSCTFRLDVSDGVQSASDLVTVTLTGLMVTVNAGNDIAVTTNDVTNIGGVVRLIQGLSGQVGGGQGTLSYEWTIENAPVGGNVSIESPTALTSALRVSGAIPVTGSYTLRLTVRDGAGIFAGDDTLNLTIAQAPTRPPVAVLVRNLTARVGELAVLDGSSSFDPDGQGGALSFLWSLDSKPSASTANLQSLATPSTALIPDVSGVYRVRLMVTDGQSLTSLPVFADVLALSAANNPPRAVLNLSYMDAATTGSINVGEEVTLTLTNSTDYEGDAIDYQWQVISAPTSLPFVASNETTYTFVPSMPGRYVLRVVPSDAGGQGVPADIVLVVAAAGRAAPRSVPRISANDDPDNDRYLTFLPGLGIGGSVGNPSVDLSAMSSSVNVGSSITYLWTQVDGPVVTLSGPMNTNASFVPGVSGTYTFRLRITDDTGLFAETDLSIDVETYDVQLNPNGNALPRASAGSDRSVEAESNLTLNATAFDADGDGQTYRWSQVSGPPVFLNNVNSSTLSVPTTRAAAFTFGVQTFDGEAWSRIDSVEVSITPKMVVVEPKPSGGGGGGGCSITDGNPLHWLVWFATLVLSAALLFWRRRRA